MNQLSEQIVKLGTDANLSVAGAESCTGGLIAKLLTDIPGSSAVFCGACVTYTNEIKMKLLGVPASIIDTYTEVSHECAKAMAEGARRAFGSDVAYSTTGYAGPGGGTVADPVGTVYIGLATKNGGETYRLSLPEASSREEIRLAAANFVLDMIKQAIGDLS